MHELIKRVKDNEAARARAVANIDIDGLTFFKKEEGMKLKADILNLIEIGEPFLLRNHKNQALFIPQHQSVFYLKDDGSITEFFIDDLTSFANHIKLALVGHRQIVKTKYSSDLLNAFEGLIEKTKQLRLTNNQKLIG